MSTMPVTITSIRHGESESNVVKNAFERSKEVRRGKDVMSVHTSFRRLTPKGREQAEAARCWLHTWMKNEGLTEGDFRFYVSPYVRAIETAGLLGIGNTWRKDSRNMERNWGTLDFMTYEEREKQYGKDVLSGREKFPFYWRPVDGETMQELLTRRYLMLKTYRRECSGRHCLQVSHGEVMLMDRYLLEYWMPEDLLAYMTHHESNVHIHNCRIIQYSRRTADGTIAEKIARVRFINPMDPNDPETNLDWQPIKRPLYTHTQLLAEAEQHPRFLVGEDLF